MSQKARIALLVALLVLVSLLGFFLTKSPASPSGVQAPPEVSASSVLAPGERVPTNFTLTRLGGGAPIHLGQLVQGHAAVINVFASWCQACASELAAFARVSNDLRRPVVFVGIDTNDPDTAKALALLRGAGARYAVGIDTAQLGVASAFGIDNLPTTLYLTSGGRLVRAVLGAQTSAQLRSEISRLH